MTRQQIEAGFREFWPLLGHCKFRDCIHEQEPNCALLAAVEAGEINATRLASYRYLVSSLEDGEVFR
jgi:ribosome biogenesis GTPase